MGDNDSVKIARIDQKVIGMDKWQDQHAKDDEKREHESNVRFERMFTYIKDGFEKIDTRFDKVDTLWDERNKTSGGFDVVKFGGQGLWALLILCVGYLINGKGH